VLLFAPGGKVRSDAEVKRLEDLSKSAVGFDVKRGDQFQISSTVFNGKTTGDSEGVRETWWMSPRTFRLAEIVGGFVLFFLIALALTKMRRGGANPIHAQLTALPQGAALLKPGSKVAEVEAAMERAALPPGPSGPTPALPGADPATQLRERARELASTDPQRAAQVLRAWINVDGEEAKRA
jgi:flagellar biosynthesis/type III secretory pathway M-ring protein FliF/YscJ